MPHAPVTSGGSSGRPAPPILNSTTANPSRGASSSGRSSVPLGPPPPAPPTAANRRRSPRGVPATAPTCRRGAPWRAVTLNRSQTTRDQSGIIVIEAHVVLIVGVSFLFEAMGFRSRRHSRTLQLRSQKQVGAPSATTTTSGDPPLSWTSQLARVCAWREPWRDGSEESSRTSSRRMR
jgi:hypothetical protein